MLITSLLVLSLCSVEVMSQIERYWTIQSEEDGKKKTLHLVGARHTSPESTQLLMQRESTLLGEMAFNEYLFTQAIVEHAGFAGFSSYYTEISDICLSFEGDTTRTFGTEHLFCDYFKTTGQMSLYSNQGLENFVAQYMMAQYLIQPDYYNDWFAEGKSRLLTSYEIVSLFQYPYLTESLLTLKNSFKPAPWIVPVLWQILAQTKLWLKDPAHRGWYPLGFRFLVGRFLSQSFDAVWAQKYTLHAQSIQNQVQQAHIQSENFLQKWLFEKNLINSKNIGPNKEIFNVMAYPRDNKMAHLCLNLLGVQKAQIGSNMLDEILKSFDAALKPLSRFGQLSMQKIVNLRSAISQKVLDYVSDKTKKSRKICPALTTNICLASEQEEHILVVVGAAHIEGMIEAMQMSPSARGLMFTAHNGSALIASYLASNFDLKNKR